jgi:uncharacterized protein
MRRPLFLVGFVLLCGCAARADLAELTLRGPEGDQADVRVEIADDPDERARGLMFRDHLADDEGMLFIFEREMPVSFWMKNTLIPLDIAFFDTDGRFVSAQTMTPCEADPCASYASGGPAAYALEMSAGFLERAGVGSGWLMEAVQLP